ncbi:hypothetical protein AB0D66_26720 [Streptomyces sp. NPDC048270]|uniref:hypothetical protein n=1 Tax=Streptomyces sp. NPDC048270 TaxID=3154615 RepID=UPI00340D522B
MKETNVRLPACAHEALAVVAAREGTSRDETVRRLLAAHVQAQESLDPDDRLTRIGTVLRYPRPPRYRRDPRSDVPLRVRASAELLTRARGVSLRLPGQYERSHRDYQGRLVTDGVMTAIAVAESFTDGFLEGLLPVLRHGSALGLWRLAAAATSTGPERELLAAAEDDRSAAAVPDRRLLLVAEALENDVAWHSPARFTVVENLARDLLTGPDAQAHEELLFAQAGQDWELLYQDTLHAADDRRTRLLAGTTAYDYTGRGGSAVWRARRRVGLQDFEDWLVKRPHSSPLEGAMNPPGWLVRLPECWHAHAPALREGALPDPYARWAGEGKLVVFPFRGRQAVWPLRDRADGSGPEPVPGIEPLLAPTAALKVEQVSGFIEALLVVWNHEREQEWGTCPFPDVNGRPTLIGGQGREEEPDRIDPLALPADKARALGLITADQQREAMARARAETLAAMEAVIEDFELDDAQDTERLDLLREAMGNARWFAQLAIRLDRRIGSRFQVVKATWVWPGASVVESLGDPRPGLVEYLAAWSHRTAALVLEQSMQTAWHRAFTQYARRM